MGYVLLFLATLSWSFVGVLVKSVSFMLDSTSITFLRFAIGVLFLGGFLWIKDRALRLSWDNRWIWIGAVGKCCNYFFENMALSKGYSYGNILVGPVQTVILLMLSAFWFKERIGPKGWFAAALCVGGVLLISWNGLPLAVFLQGHAAITFLYVVSAIGAAFHVLSQKMLIRSMDAGNMNFSVFFWCSLLMALPLPAQAHMTGPVQIVPLLAVTGLGLITGLSFYWFSQALTRVSFPVAIIVSNSGVLFTIVWAYLIYHDPVTPYIVGGAAVFVSGLVLLNLPVRKPAARVRQERGASVS
ncbi:DMT family transporter [Paenibacillus filicis]|uniref:DMT family transporter n=1 Tax=Paenibacillus gyeongsangnamensis TaxID=3388067 RepID=A0ABT4QCD6_9BACL|nr:DMT family transporter [Paenibacillus filicis]MCZ8514526.1 DMT family transporter [Paenibacillus filicis]